MATLSNKRGRRMIQVIVGGARKTIRLGKTSERDARGIKAHIENIVNAADSSMPIPAETAKWIGTIGHDLHAKLAKMKLVHPRKPRQPTQLGSYFENYITNRTDLKPRTIINLRQAEKSIVGFFGRDREMTSITRGEVKDWHRLESAKRAAATVSMYVKKGRQIFADAIDRKLLEDNPFKAVKAGAMTNADRLVYVPAEHILQVIDHCPDDEWKLLFAMARFEGVRIPSETRPLRWNDIDWSKSRIRIRSPKTAHHVGKEMRTVPIFPQVMPHLLRMFNDPEREGHDFVFHRLRGDNFSTSAEKIIERAGLEPWGKTFQNLRSSCETDLAMLFPLHVACAWIGNTESVARKHYLQVTDGHFDQAIGGAAKSAAGSVGEARTETAHQSKNPQEIEGFAHHPLPPREVEESGNVLENMQSAHVALQNALRRLNPNRQRRKLITHLEGKVNAAKGGVG